MTKIRTLLVDDEPLALEGLAVRLEAFDDIEIAGTCKNGREAIKAVRAEHPHLMFLDIQMPGFNGFQVVQSLVGEDMPLVIFVTAFDQYAVSAFENHALDYLLKPVETERLKQAIDRARDRIHEKGAYQQNKKLVALLKDMGTKAPLDDALGSAPTRPRYDHRINIKDRGRIICVDTNDIDWIDAAGDYMCIHVDGETHILRETMKTLERRLDPAKFQRVHRSTIVNLGRVEALHPHTNGECFLKLQSGADIKVSRSYRHVVSRFL
ncbi:MAG: response regulator [Pseudomonadota bacterium]